MVKQRNIFTGKVDILTDPSDSRLTDSGKPVNFPELHEYKKGIEATILND